MARASRVKSAEMRKPRRRRSAVGSLPDGVLVASPVADVTRSVKWSTRLYLSTVAGGRCEFRGCNEYLFEHHVTLTMGNFAQYAHIVAFKPDGPRGRDGIRPAEIHAITNLMFLCPRCHTEIDRHPKTHPRTELEAMKAEHEARIRMLTGIAPKAKTLVVTLEVPPRGSPPLIDPFAFSRAIYPRYPHAIPPVEIGLNVLKDVAGPALYGTACQVIDSKIAEIYAQGAPVHSIRHLSLFALAPIPLLVYLGGRLSNEMEVDFYQRHRDTQDWVWKADGEPAHYELRKLRDGSDPTVVGLVLSLSGPVDMDRLPKIIRESGTIYEISLKGRIPGTDFLRQRADLERFAATYRRFLSTVERDHRGANELHLFPAVPAPIAVVCGFERQPDVHPEFVIYNNDGPGDGFVRAVVLGDQPATVPSVAARN